MCSVRPDPIKVINLHSQSLFFKRNVKSAAHPETILFLLLNYNLYCYVQLLILSSFVLISSLQSVGGENCERNKK